MKIGVPKETRAGEARVAVSPDTVKKYCGLGYEVTVEKGAGAGASIPDELFKDAGATIAATAKAAAEKADIVLKVQRPTEAEAKNYRAGSVLACVMSPYGDEASTKAVAAQKITSFAMEFMPRITRAQSMDVLSSQSNLAGYRAVIDASHEFTRVFPMMMTAAGTIAPAKVFVMGAGVAGLQAIATARRLGAVVSATDVRRAAGEQVESLGAKFIMVETAEDMETEGGYAKELSADEQKRQAELVANHVKNQDIVITTALIPGRPAPKLISKAMIESMKPGSVLVDLAVEAGGNCEGAKLDEIADINGVKIIGFSNMPSRLAVDASALYAKNLLNFLSAFSDEDKGELKIDWDDEIIKGTLLTKDGAIVHEATQKAIGGVPAKKAAPKAKKSSTATKTTAKPKTATTTTASKSNDAKSEPKIEPKKAEDPAK